MKLLLAALLVLPPTAPEDTYTHEIQEVTISMPIKHPGNLRDRPVAATTLTMSELDARHVVEPKNLSLVVPNLLHADYGARMTGSIYVRGLGSRMDQPAVGLYVDGVPVLNKNNYDFDYFDLRRLDVLRGPQGTLYGRNTIGGVIDVQTLSPFDYQGTRASVGYGNGGSWQASAAVYRRPNPGWGWSVAASHRATEGFYTNTYDGTDADRQRSSAVRAKAQVRLSDRWMMDNALYVNVVNQSGFAYAPYDEATGAVGPIAHNDPNGYERLGLTDGLTFRYDGPRLRLAATASYQYTDDQMTLDQDFSPTSLFTLRQSQAEHAATGEVTARSVGGGRWQWIAGVFGFYRGLRSQAPVTMKRDGIDRLILENANAGIHTARPEAELMIAERQFGIDSDFKLPARGVSLYHQSSWTTGRWELTAGLRADYELTAIRYANDTEIHYRLTPDMADYKPLAVSMAGERDKGYFEVLPRVAARYKTPFGNLYASVARGYKAGGYNTQIFSDILQNAMMGAMMTELGVYLDNATTYDTERAISYAPERSWNYEVGGHIEALGGRLLADVALFWIDCRNQQLTVFPPGNGTGRLMSNAGRTRSVGVEVSAVYRWRELSLAGSYGHTNAEFIEYNDGRADYAGRAVPYAPTHTLSARADYRVALRGGRAGSLLLGAGVQGAGRIWWNEANTVGQPFYTVADASAGWSRGRVTLTLWGRNLTGADYNTFYFKSVGSSFVQRAKPLQVGVTVGWEM